MHAESAPARLDTGGMPGEIAIRCGRALGSRPHMLDGHLADLVARGYEAAELSVQSLHCILGGGLVERNVAAVAAACAAHAADLRYSVHAPAVLDLRDRREPEMHRRILMASVQFAAAIGAAVLVVHFEARSPEPEVEEGFRAAIANAAELAGRHGLILGIENIEVERSEVVLEFLEHLNHPWVRMTYDFGHNYLAGNLFGYDHVVAARACAPYVAHLHITDNFGRFNQARLGDFNLYQAIPHSDVAILGIGDLHLPLGLGTLPAREVFAAVAPANFQGLLISEHDYFHYDDADREVLAAMHALVSARE